MANEILDLLKGKIKETGAAARKAAFEKNPAGVLIIVLSIFSCFVITGSFNSNNMILGWTVFVILLIINIIYIVMFVKNNKFSNENDPSLPFKYILGISIPICYILVAILLAVGGLGENIITIDLILGSFMFFTVFGVCITVIAKLLLLIFNPEAQKFYRNDAGTFLREDEFTALKTEVEKGKYQEVSGINSGLPVLIFKILRVIALSVYMMTSVWVMVASPFSFFGGSLYGGFMQLAIIVPLALLLSSFWVSGNNIGLIMITLASFGAYMLSFMFPTLFANLWIMSTTSSAGAGASTISSFSAISPLSYYKSTYVVRTGTTEKRMGPTYELISDDVVSSTFSVLGRLCDESVIIASLNFQNRAKYELSDLSVQMSALRSPYCFGSEVDSGSCNICAVNFTVGNKGATYTETIDNLPKGVPKTVNVPFTTWLPADVMQQVCKVRSNILVNYHTTSVFPLSFIDYDAYLFNPENIGNPLSTSSFGKVLISMDVGQQPVVVNNDTRLNDRVLLKMAWSQKGGGVVNTPKLVLFLPENLGVCKELTTAEVIKSYTGSSGSQYTGIYGYNRDKTEIFKKVDFTCYTYNESTNNISAFCDNLLTTRTRKAAESLLYYTPEYESSFKGLPSFTDACEDLTAKGYRTCISNRDIIASEVLICSLSLADIDVSEVDLATYLIRADALYSFNVIKEEQFMVDNCNAI